MKEQMFVKNGKTYRTYKCIGCGKIRTIRNRLKNRKFCSSKCYNLHMFGTNNPFSGKNHSTKTKRHISKVRLERGLSKGKNNPMFGKITYSKMFFVKELNHGVRSYWEKNVCLLLKKYKINYKYEPKVFDLGECTYRPDLQLTKRKYIEIKGPLYDFHIKKMMLFKKKNKNIRFIVITRAKRNKKKLHFVDKIINYDDLFKKNVNVRKMLQ